MSKFDEMINSKKRTTPKQQPQEVEGCFSCQTCDEVVEVARMGDGLLVWKCSRGHLSKIKGFEL